MIDSSIPDVLKRAPMYSKEESVTIIMTKLRSQVSRVLKKTAHEFSRSHVYVCFKGLPFSCFRQQAMDCLHDQILLFQVDFSKMSRLKWRLLGRPV
jgi:hypothetical protein